MVELLKKYIDKYNLRIQEDIKGRSSFVTLTDSQVELPPIIVHFVNQRIYSVSFLSNDFFEIPDDQLYFVLESILQGQYKVKSSWFSKKKIVIIPQGNHNIIPERVHDNGSGYPSEQLPSTFTQRD